jgi:hypothetical protein
MKLITAKSLLIVITATAILTGCNSNDKKIEIETETTTEEATTETTSESETETTEIETTTVEETTEEETSTIEETTTATNSTDTAESAISTANSDDAVTRRANYKSKYSTNYNADYELYDWLDDDGDGVITDEEAAVLEDALDRAFSNITTSDSSTSTSDSSSTTSSSSNSSWVPMDPTVPDRPNASEMDDAGFSTTCEVQ